MIEMTWFQQFLLEHWDSLPVAVQETAPLPILDELRLARRIQRVLTMRRLSMRQLVRAFEQACEGFGRMAMAAAVAGAALEDLGVHIRRADDINNAWPTKEV